MTQYKKYLPRLVFDYLHYKLTNNPPSIPKLDVDIFYSILSDLSDIRFANSYEDDNEFIPMASTYLKVKYGNSYASYTHYLINNSIVCRTPYSNDRCDYYKLVEVDTLLITTIQYPIVSQKTSNLVLKHQIILVLTAFQNR